MRRIAALIASSLLITSGHAEDVEASRAEITEFSVRVHFDTQQHILDKCNSLHAWPEPVERAPRGMAVGCSFFDLATKTQDIYTIRPTHVDDSATTTLGHELSHAIFGRYHG